MGCSTSGDLQTEETFTVLEWCLFISDLVLQQKSLGRLACDFFVDCLIELKMRRFDKLKKSFPFLAHFHVYRVSLFFILLSGAC